MTERRWQYVTAAVLIALCLILGAVSIVATLHYHR
jgi:hypothetical protein